MRDAIASGWLLQSPQHGPHPARIDKHYSSNARRVALIFGVVTMLSGIIGVPLGSWLGAALVKRYPRAHPVICAAGLLVSAPALTLAILLSEGYFYLTFALIFVAEVALNLNWAIVADMSLVRTCSSRGQCLCHRNFVGHINIVQKRHLS